MLPSKDKSDFAKFYSLEVAFFRRPVSLRNISIGLPARTEGCHGTHVRPRRVGRAVCVGGINGVWDSASHFRLDLIGSCRKPKNPQTQPHHIRMQTKPQSNLCHPPAKQQLPLAPHGYKSAF